jgi:hypothetical protein
MMGGLKEPPSMTKRNRTGRAWLAAGLAVALASCGSSTSPSATPSPTRSTETFTGSLTAKGAVYHLFTVATLGQVDVTLTKTDPLATITLGLGVTQTASGACIPVLLAYNNASVAGTVITGTADIGSYCAAVYDVGNVGTDTVTYTVTVTHP